MRVPSSAVTHGQITVTTTITTLHNDLTELGRVLPAGTGCTVDNYGVNLTASA